jgi:hypothetical protein
MSENIPFRCNGERQAFEAAYFGIFLARVFLGASAIKLCCAASIRFHQPVPLSQAAALTVVPKFKVCYDRSPAVHAGLR